MILNLRNLFICSLFVIIACGESNGIKKKTKNSTKSEILNLYLAKRYNELSSMEIDLKNLNLASRLYLFDAYTMTKNIVKADRLVQNLNDSSSTIFNIYKSYIINDYENLKNLQKTV